MQITIKVLISGQQVVQDKLTGLFRVCNLWLNQHNFGKCSYIIDRYKVLCTNSIHEYLKVRGLKPQAVASREFVYIVDSIINLK